MINDKNIEFNFIDVKNMHPHRVSNPGSWNTVKFVKYTCRLHIHCNNKTADNWSHKLHLNFHIHQENVFYLPKGREGNHISIKILNIAADFLQFTHRSWNKKRVTRNQGITSV